MSKFHERIRTILQDFESFLDGTKDSKLSSASRAKKGEILEQIRGLRDEWPQLSADKNNDSKPKTNGTAHPPQSPSVSTRSSDSQISAGELKTDATMHGALKRKNKSKKGLFGGGTEKLYCIIKDDTMHVFDKDAKKHIESFSIEGSTFECEEAKKDIPFDITVGDQKFTFIVANRDELEKWKVAVQGEEKEEAEDEELYEDTEQGDMYELPDEETNQGSRIKSVSSDQEDEIYDDTMDDDTTYDDTTEAPAPPVGFRPPPPNRPVPQVSQTDPDDELYDDNIAHDDAGDELYDDNMANGDDDDIYEAFDEQEPEPEPEPVKKKPEVKPPPLPETSIPPGKNKSALHTSIMRSVPPPLPQGGPPSASKPSPPTPAPPAAEFDPEKDFGNYYYALWGFKGSSDDEMDMRRGDLLYVRHKGEELGRWWVAQIDGFVGLVPCDYLRPAYVQV